MSKYDKIKATLADKKLRLASQTIKIDDEWSIVRIDDLNWQIKQKGRKGPWDRWYYGSLKGAFFGVFEKALNENPWRWREEGLVPLAERIQGCLDKLQP